MRVQVHQAPLHKEYHNYKESFNSSEKTHKNCRTEWVKSATKVNNNKIMSHNWNKTFKHNKIDIKNRFKSWKNNFKQKKNLI